MTKSPQLEPLMDIAHLASMELYTPKLKESTDHFTTMLGMEITEKTATSVCLRAYEDTYKYSLKLTKRDRPGGGVITFRTQSRQALERRAKVLEETGLGDGWIDSDLSNEKAYAFRSPDGHKMQLIWEVIYPTIAKENKSGLLNRPSKRPLNGIPVRRIDHVNLMASKVTPVTKMLVDQLGFRVSENVILDDGTELAAWYRVTSLMHDMAVMQDATGAKGRFHHVAYWYGQPQHLMDIADHLMEAGVKIEAGPSKHGISQAYHLYYLEPGGNRVELFGDSGYLIFDPTHKTITWPESKLGEALIWVGAALPADFFVYGTPIVEMDSQK